MPPNLQACTPCLRRRYLQLDLDRGEESYLLATLVQVSLYSLLTFLARSYKLLLVNIPFHSYLALGVDVSPFFLHQHSTVLPDSQQSIVLNFDRAQTHSWLTIVPTTFHQNGSYPHQ